MEKKSSILFLIHNVYKNLTPSERKIADYILNNPQKIIYINIESLAECCKTSIATISRFCKKIDIEGFYYLKLCLAKEFVNSSNNEESEREEKGVKLQTYRDIVTLNSEILVKSIEQFDDEKLKKVVSIIAEKKNIYFFAMGTSGTLAMEAWNKFTRLGIKCSFTLDFHSQILQASILDKEDIAIIFSHSGINKDILNLVEIIKKRGAYSIGITNFSKTSFETSVDTCLSFFSNYMVKESLTGLVSRIPLLLIIETIYKSLEFKLNSGDLEKEYKEIFKERSI